MLSHVLVYIALIFVAIAISSCGDLSEPLSEVSLDTYIASGPGDGSVVIEPSVAFQWEGGNHLVSEFSYRCTPGQENWSVWSPDTSITLNYLDQGDYVFEVRGRYEPGNEDDTPVGRTFTVNIPGPGVLMRPLKQKVMLGQEFNVDVVADDVEDLMLAHLLLKFEPAELQALDAAPGEIFQSSDLPVFFKQIDNSQGMIDISISTATIMSSINVKPSISGTGAIATVRFKSLSVGESSVSFHSGSELRDSANRPISIINQIGSAVEIVGAQY